MIIIMTNFSHPLVVSKPLFIFTIDLPELSTSGIVSCKRYQYFSYQIKKRFFRRDPIFPHEDCKTLVAPGMDGQNFVEWSYGPSEAKRVKLMMLLLYSLQTYEKRPLKNRQNQYLSTND